jgi:hypothetical protein
VFRIDNRCGGLFLNLRWQAFCLILLKKRKVKREIEEDDLRRVSFWGKHRFPLQKQRGKAPNTPKGPKAAGSG